MKRAIGAVLFVVYSIIAIAVTVLILSFNEYKCSEIGDYTIHIIQDDALEPDYKQGSILIMKNTADRHIQVGDEMFFYKVITSQEFEIVNRTLERKTQQGRHILYEVSEGEQYVADYFIGKADDTIVIEGPWGTILSILESKWGYLFCIVIVSLLLFLQEVFDLIIELRYGGTKGTKAANVAHARKTANKKPVAKSTTTKTGTPKKTTTATKTTTVKKVAPVEDVNNTPTKEEEEV